MSLLDHINEPIEPNEYTYYDRLTESQVDLTYNSDGYVQRDMWILFYGSEGTHWWNKYLEEGFTHCLTIQWDGFMWILNNHALDHTSTRTIPVEEWEDVKKYVMQFHKGTNYRWVHVNNVLDSKRSSRLKWLFTPYTCTELVKAHVGIEDYFVWTPYQLYTHIHSVGMVLTEELTKREE